MVSVAHHAELMETNLKGFTFKRQVPSARCLLCKCRAPGTRLNPKCSSRCARVQQLLGRAAASADVCVGPWVRRHPRYSCSRLACNICRLPAPADYTSSARKRAAAETGTPQRAARRRCACRRPCEDRTPRASPGRRTGSRSGSTSASARRSLSSRPPSLWVCSCPCGRSGSYIADTPRLAAPA